MSDRPPCPKCKQSDRPKYVYHAGDDNTRPDCIVGEHMHITCKVCGFVRVESTAAE